MKKRAFCRSALERIKKIHRLSRSYNRKVRVSHDRRLLDLMSHHAGEIRELYRDRNKHYLIETGDLLVLCCEILLEGRASIDATVLKCFERYEKKLTALIRETDAKG